MTSSELLNLQSLIPDLPAVVENLLRQIPSGTVTTYGDIARALGDDHARSARWLGKYLSHHRHPAECGCHRVVRVNGAIGLYSGGDASVKAGLLCNEGVALNQQGQADLSRRFTTFVSSHPLRRLSEYQRELAQRVSHENRRIRETVPRTYGGVDVAYTADGQSFAVYVSLNALTLEVEATLSLSRPTRFPYIPGYLTFRELPVMLEICLQARAAGMLADVLFCDGNGSLHPWKSGIATCLGVLLDHPVIGIGKSLLCGRILSSSIVHDFTAVSADPIIDHEELIGAALKLPNQSKPVYVSVGNHLTLLQAISFARQASRNRRLPEPIYQADRFTKKLKPRP